MERIGNGPSIDANAEDRKNQLRFRRTFGQKVAEVFNKEDASADTQSEYLKRVQEERALLETLDSEQRQFQDYIFYFGGIPGGQITDRPASGVVSGICEHIIHIYYIGSIPRR